MAYKNKERRSATISLVIFLISAAAVAFPFLIDADMESWGFGVAFMGGIVGLTAFLVFLMYNGRAKVRNRMFQNENILAHWRYSEEYWKQVTANDIADAGIGRIVGFFLGGIFLLIGIVVFAADPDENGGFLLIMLGVAVFFVIIGFISVGAEKRRARASAPEAIIAQEGLFFKNILYTWNNHAISYLESVTMHPAEPSTLLFVLRQLSSRRGHMAHYHQYFLPVPIPPDQESSAGDIIRYFNLPMTPKRWESMRQDPDAKPETESEED